MDLSDTQLFFGELTATLARCYARLPVNAQGHIVGTIAGPRCRYARTLQLRVPLQPVGASAPDLLQAVVTDPCDWTPEMPFLYDIELAAGSGADGQSFRGVVGFRPLAPLGRQLRLAGHNWVLRAARSESVVPASLADWRAHDLAMVIPNPSDELCGKASEIGVLILAVVDASLEPPLAELRRLARYPAVGFALLAGIATVAAEFREAAPNLVFATRAARHLAPDDVPQVLVADSVPAGTLEVLEATSVPVLVDRPLGAAVTIEAARQACDLLQRDVAGWLVDRHVQTRPAGYIV